MAIQFRFHPARSFCSKWLPVIPTIMALALAMSFNAVGQATDSDVITVQQHAVTPHLETYAQVEPISVVQVSAAEAGEVTGLKALPGVHVRAGQELAHLSGPAIQALLLQGQADLRSAQSQLEAARKSLAIQRQQFPSHLTTRQAVHQAESLEVQAGIGVENARSRLNAARQMMTVLAPADGIVLALNGSNGELVSAGQPILTLQPAKDLWLRAAYYGSDLAKIRVGMKGEFLPADGREAIPVRVRSIPGMLGMGGGESIALAPMKPDVAWVSGEAGKVTLDLPPRRLVAVPTRALILNQGKWWVMVHTDRGDRPQAVVPGPAQGWNTFIESGVSPGTKIVVNNAYLLFHSGVSEHYQIPD